jgi:RND family efflux transporter MFP subunit
MKTDIVWKILTAAALAGIFIACSKGHNDDSEVKPRAVVEVATVQLGSIADVVNATGSFEVLRDEKVKSPIAGKIEKVLVLEGDRVEKGEPVAVVVSQESYAAIAGATQLLNQAATESEKKQAEEALRLAESSAASARISAPFGGAVIHRFATEGELVSQGSDLVEIIDPSTEYFLASVPVDCISSVKPGQTATVAIPGVNVPPLRGAVRAINPATDPNSQTVEVRIDLRSIPPNIVAGTFGNVRITTGEHRSTVLVPKQAVYHDDELGQYFVWRIQGDSIALLTQIKVGLSDSLHFEITSGIKPGDVVATVGGYGLPDSTDVRVE